MLQALMEALLLPPSGFFVLLVLAALATWWWRCRAVFVVALALVWLLSTPAVSALLAERLERQIPVFVSETLVLDAGELQREEAADVASPFDHSGALAERPMRADAGQSPRPVIAVLGGGRDVARREYGGRDRPSALALERLAYAVQLHRSTGWPLALTGGVDPLSGGESEAALFARVLAEQYGVRASYLEAASRNTRENAQFLADLLRSSSADGELPPVVLVTQAMHMPRSLREFSAAGFTPVAAPVDFRGLPQGGDFSLGSGKGLRRIFVWIPDLTAIETTRFALRETLASLRNRVVVWMNRWAIG